MADGQFCEKCQRIPAQYLLEAAQRRKAKGKQKKRKEEDDFELDEVEQAIALGGWLEVSLDRLYQVPERDDES